MSHCQTDNPQPPHLCTVSSTNSNKAVAILSSPCIYSLSIDSVWESQSRRTSTLQIIPSSKTRDEAPHNCIQKSVTVTLWRQWLTMVFSRNVLQTKSVSVEEWVSDSIRTFDNVYYSIWSRVSWFPLLSIFNWYFYSLLFTYEDTRVTSFIRVLMSIVYFHGDQCKIIYYHSLEGTFGDIESGQQDAFFWYTTEHWNYRLYGEADFGKLQLEWTTLSGPQDE